LVWCGNKNHMGFLETLKIILSNVFYEINIKLDSFDVVLGFINEDIGSTLPWLVLLAFAGYDIFYFFKNIKKRDVFLLWFIWIVMEVLAIAFFWLIPDMVSKYTKMPSLSIITRWLIIIVVSVGVARVYGREHGGERWWLSITGHLGIFLLGWVINKWVGIFLISLPLILAYYSALFILAMVTLPASNPEAKFERWKRFLVLVSYTWGVQSPILVVADHAWKKADTRINGSFGNNPPFPGLIWTKSHHVVGLTNGTQFNRVAGPGVIFTGKSEQPFQIMDLRLQLRANEIEAVTKDGINFIVRVFTAFRLDPEIWDEDTYAKMLEMNPFLQDADKPSHTVGSFPFSHRRVQAAISTTSAKTTEPENPTLWDQWVLNMVDEETRKVVSQKTLDEFWRPLHDQKNADAMSGIAQEIKDRLVPMMRSKGILLVASRIVNFKLPLNGKDKMAGITKQQIATWGADWERKRTNKLADAEANAEKDQQEARAYAEAQLLNSIAEVLQKIHEINPQLPKHVIAMRYLNALQDYARNNTPEEEEKIKEQHNNSRTEQ
jgi:hypothetical protein